MVVHDLTRTLAEEDMGRKEEEAAWAKVGKKPPKPSRFVTNPKPKETAAQKAKRKAKETAKNLGNAIPGSSGMQALNTVLSQPKKKKKRP